MSKIKFEKSPIKKRHYDREELSKRTSGKNNGMYGKKHSEETKKQMSILRKGENSWWYGKKHTKETIEKMRLSAKNRKNTFNKL